MFEVSDADKYRESEGEGNMLDDDDEILGERDLDGSIGGGDEGG